MVTNTTTAVELVETGEKRDLKGRRITPAGQRAALVAAWRSSGLTQAAFARSEGIKYTTFCSWAQEEAGARPRKLRFAEVKMPDQPGRALEVRLPDGTLLRGGSAAELAALVKILRT
jgi:hypothetical protein